MFLSTSVFIKQTPPIQKNGRKLTFLRKMMSFQKCIRNNNFLILERIILRWLISFYLPFFYLGQLTHLQFIQNQHFFATNRLKPGKELRPDFIRRPSINRTYKKISEHAPENYHFMVWSKWIKLLRLYNEGLNKLSMGYLQCNIDAVLKKMNQMKYGS
jgi:hypothetical protein